MNAKDEAHVPSYCRYLLTALCGAHAKHSRAQTSPKGISTHGYLVLTAAWKGMDIRTRYLPSILEYINENEYTDMIS